MKRSTFILIMLLCAVGLRAQTMVDCIIVQTADGHQTRYLLKEIPQIRQAADGVTLKTKTTTIEMQADDITRIFMSKADPAGIEPVAASDGSFHLQENFLQLSGFSSGERVALYRTDGIMLWQKAIDASGSLSVSLDPLPAGIYIVKANRKTIKITKK